MKKHRCIGQGLAVGMVSGVAASWVMNQFFALQGKLQEQQQSEQERRQSEQQKRQRAEDNPTVKVAQVIAEPALGRPLQSNEKKSGGAIVHYVFGGLMGGLYGVLAELNPMTTT